MARNLHLRPDAEAALREKSERTHRSQQDLIRAAIDRDLGLVDAAPASDLDALVATGKVRPPRTAHRKLAKRLTLPDGLTAEDLLDRDDRV